MLVVAELLLVVQQANYDLIDGVERLLGRHSVVVGHYREGDGLARLGGGISG
jgi:hypothetical protein